MHNDWKQNSERADYACEFRKEAKKVEAKKGQTIVSHVSTAEVQAPEQVSLMVDFRCGDKS